MSDVKDLVSQLRKDTEGEQASSSHGPSYEFTPPEQSKDLSEESSHFEPVSVSDLSDKPDPNPLFTKDKADSTARRWIKLFSTGMKILFKPIYRLTILEKGDIEKMKKFRATNPRMSDKDIEDAIHSDHELYPVMNRFDKYMQAVEDTPLDQDEIDSIAEPLSEVIMKYRKLQLSPEWMLVIAVALAMLPRLAPMMPDLSKVFGAASSKK